jgi:ATP-dependent Clp protease ATP-binding subunit ClpA
LQAKELTEAVKDSIEKLLHKTFRPEFLNRIDSIVFFKKLTEVDVQKIAEIQLQQIIDRLAAQHITISIDDKVTAHLAEEGYSSEFGARPLKRTIQQLLLVPISRFLLQNPETKHLAAKLVKDKIVIE